MLTDGLLFGLAVRVNGSGISSPHVAGDESCDVAVQFVTAPPAAERGALHFATCKCVRADESLRVRMLDDGAVELWFGDGTWSGIDRHGSRVDVFTPASSTFDDTLVYITGPIMGFVLRMRGVLALHASAIIHDGYAIAFAGTSGRGKSTLAAALAQAGSVVLTEDLLALDPPDHGGRVTAHCGYDYVRLWPDSAALLEAPNLATVTPTWDKLRFPIAAPPASAPLGVVYCLDAPDAAGGRGFSAPLSPANAVIELLPDTYLPQLLRPNERAHELLSLGELVRHVPVRRLVPPALPHGVAALQDLLAEDLHSFVHAGA
jgi:hypothetical protein